MGEHVELQTGDIDLSNTEMVFDNLTMLKEFSNIANIVRNEDFLETVPKAKLRRVKWVPMFNCLKQGILDEMVQELSSLWKYENIPQKLETLEKQKEKFCDANPDEPLWRPQLGDVKAQLKATDVARLQKQKVLLESLAKEYESRVNRMKKTLSAKRGYLKALHMDIQKYQKKNEDFITQIIAKVEIHKRLVQKIIPTQLTIEEMKWSDDDMENDEINPGNYLNKIYISEKFTHLRKSTTKFETYFFEITPK